MLSLVPNLSWSCTCVFSMNTNSVWTRFLPWFVMATCVDEKTFYKKLELLRENSKSKITVYIAQTFYDNAKNYLEVQDKKRQRTEAELSKHNINTIKWKGWALKDGKILTRDNKIVVPKSELHKVLCQCHSSTAHRGRDKTNNYVKGIYSKILTDKLWRHIYASIQFILIATPTISAFLILLLLLPSEIWCFTAKGNWLYSCDHQWNLQRAQSEYVIHSSDALCMVMPPKIQHSFSLLHIKGQMDKSPPSC